MPNSPKNRNIGKRILSVSVHHSCIEHIPVQVEGDEVTDPEKSKSLHGRLMGMVLICRNPPTCRRVLWMLLVYVLCLAVIFPSARIFTTPPHPPLSYYIMKTKKQDMDVADRPAMFSLTACLAPAFCFLFRMVLFIVKRHRLISRRVLWMSFGSAYV